MKIGSQILSFNTLDSTNSYISKKIREKSIHSGTIVKTAFQTHGKGHFGSVWEGEKGLNLLFSFLLLDPPINIEVNFYLSKFVSLAVGKYVKHKTGNAFIKWPNDIYCSHNKIAGILIENSLMSGLVKSTIIGIGLNVNQLDFSGNFNATSLKKETGKEYVVDDVLDELVQLMNDEYEKLVNKRLDLMDEEYLSMLYNYKKWTKYKDADGEFEGEILGVKKEGNLMVRKRQGKIYYYGFKEIAIVQEGKENEVI